jgi:hypothetical protein
VAAARMLTPFEMNRLNLICVDSHVSRRDLVLDTCESIQRYIS